MGHHRWISGIGFIVGIVFGFIIRPMFGNSILPDVPQNIQGFLLFLITLVVSEKFSSLAYQQTLDEKIKHLDENSRAVIEKLEFKLMPVDIQSIGNGIEACRMLGGLLKDATSVKNTYFLSLSKEDRGDLTDYNFIAGITIIENVCKIVEQGKSWTDVVSISGMERVFTLALLFKKKNIDNQTYIAHKANHNKPMINFIIIEYEDKPSTVLFGWGLHRSQRMAPVFICKNKEIVLYFEKYFESLTLEEKEKIKMKDYIKQDSSHLKKQLQDLMPDDLIQSIQEAFPDI